MALPTLDATFASSADLPRKQMLAKWLVSETGETFPSNVLVSGLQGGGSYVPDGPNGLYTYVGEENGKPKYEYVAQNEEPFGPSGTFILKWEPDVAEEPPQPTWLILAPSTDTIARAVDDTTYPWESTAWEAFDTGSGSPVVTESPASSPLSNYYDLPERYLWAKIAVAAGGPKTEADYISLPKNYAWSDIYNAVSGDIAQSTIVVSGTTSANGSYVYSGLESGRPKYELNENFSISWDGGNSKWDFLADGDVVSSYSNVSYPWLATGWSGDFNTANLVLTPQTPNHTDWSENVALGHIAAAYRGDTGNPANLATYIDWPWRYKVASIIISL